MANDQAMNHGRRGFLRLLALVGMSSAVGRTAVSLAADPPAKPAAAAAAAADTTAVPDAPPEPSPDARALAGIVERRYGRHLTPEQLADVTRELDGRLRLGEALRKVELANADEPDFVFGA